ncbi:FkbM family methyltransferase [Primorskyibacter sp. 2E233]|uniref:FkbM family methyltransferase n=1 Tax=Primorskyibacter sp. 2E233 TaxID=3413431 RepID=UPI003BF1D27D
MTQIAIAAECKGVRVPASPFLTETRIRRIEEARYEGEEIAGALAIVQRDDRVLEMGAGLGIVGAVIAVNARPAAVLSFEANPDLVPHIKALHQENGLQNKVELRNQVLISAPDRPETVTFYLRNSFLGSSLIDQSSRRTRPVEVPTASFAEVRKAFRPTVLIMDIEGGELDFLTHADLAGIRAVVIEFHPDVYGIDGAKTCKDRLRQLGFRKQVEHSTRFVWTCVRAPALASKQTPPPSPQSGFAPQIQVHEQAVVLAPCENSLAVPSGVISVSGEDVPEAALWRNKRRLNLPFSLPEDEIEELPGTWLWGGTLWQYFAHFIVESSCRLWGLDHLNGEKPDGIVFIPRRHRGAQEFASFQTGFFEALGVDLPIHVVHPAARVERLIVPNQGFGLGEISAGTPAFRNFMHRRFGEGIAADGPENLYISRSRLGPKRGALVGEARIEQELAAQGYEIFHPERHDMPTQIARYKAARRILASEGSALHLFGFVGRADQRVGVITRRKSMATQHILSQLRSFTGAEPVLLDTLRRVWQHKETPRARLSTGEPDLPKLQHALVREGFIQPGPIWEPLAEADVLHELGDQYTTPPTHLAAE